METETEVRDNAASGQESPLADVFPGRTHKLSNGSLVTVHKWTAREIVHEVPALFGRIALKLTGAFRDGTISEVQLGGLIGGLASEIAELVAFTTKKPVDELLALDADEFMMLARETLEVNIRFFGEIASLYQLAKRDLPGT